MASYRLGYDLFRTPPCASVGTGTERRRLVLSSPGSPPARAFVGIRTTVHRSRRHPRAYGRSHSDLEPNVSEVRVESGADALQATVRSGWRGPSSGYHVAGAPGLLGVAPWLLGKRDAMGPSGRGRWPHASTRGAISQAPERHSDRQMERVDHLEGAVGLRYARANVGELFVVGQLSGQVSTAVKAEIRYPNAGSGPCYPLPWESHRARRRDR